MSQALEIVFEDNHLLAVIKPAGIATMGLPEGEETLFTLAKDDLKRRYNKPGNVYLGVVSRLDFQVSGIIVFAKTSKAAARLNEQFRNRDAEKTYHAIVEGIIHPKNATLTDHLCEDPRHRKMWVTAKPNADSKEAMLSYRFIDGTKRYSFLEVTLETGRKHQIRLQLAHHGYPILGDRKYGARDAFPHGIALHAGCLVIEHPVTRQPLELRAPLPDFWKKFLEKS
ncbi:MAG: RluA family pseudouridine synthase [Planctomycetaceae bacterium]|nr:RluA family pseudouridine synthase [Planctomycetaceae bacterium]